MWCNCGRHCGIFAPLCFQPLESLSKKKNPWKSISRKFSWKWFHGNFQVKINSSDQVTLKTMKEIFSFSSLENTSEDHSQVKINCASSPFSQLVGCCCWYKWALHTILNFLHTLWRQNNSYLKKTAIKFGEIFIKQDNRN